MSRTFDVTLLVHCLAGVLGLHPWRFVYLEGRCFQDMPQSWSTDTNASLSIVALPAHGGVDTSFNFPENRSLP